LVNFLENKHCFSTLLVSIIVYLQIDDCTEFSAPRLITTLDDDAAQVSPFSPTVTALQPQRHLQHHCHRSLEARTREVQAWLRTLGLRLRCKLGFVSPMLPLGYSLSDMG
jgi:hypothetical protein